ncbi:MAG: ion transporter [Nanoarchaeota archaeon]
MEEYFIEEKSNFDKLLDFLVFIAVFAVTIFLILEILAGSGKTNLNLEKINEIYFTVNIFVFAIFVVDLIRLYKESTGMKNFLKGNWLDILATIPFGLIAQGMVSFEVLKLARVSRLLKLTRVQKVSRISKITKEFKAASHLKKESEEYQRKHRV